MAPNAIQVLIPGPVNVALYSKREFADVIKLRLLRWGDYPGLSEWAVNVITSVPFKREAEGDLSAGEKAIRGRKPRLE